VPRNENEGESRKGEAGRGGDEEGGGIQLPHRGSVRADKQA